MIVPMVDEEAWLSVVGSLPAWEPPEATMLIVAPHPDDETLGPGGLIATQRLRGVEIVVAAVTDGEHAYADCPGLGAVRSVEQVNALERLGVRENEIVRFGLPDGDVASQERDLVERLMQLASENTHIVAPWRGDFHPDHEACGRAAEEVARRTGARLTSYFFWTWHRGTAALLRGLPLRSLALHPNVLLAKNDALLCHRSQLNHPSGEPILPEFLLAPARRPFEVFLIA